MTAVVSFFQCSYAISAVDSVWMGDRRTKPQPQYFTALCLIVIIVCNEANDNRTKIVLSKELSLLEGRIRIDN
jgi:hypothetical protein